MEAILTRVVQALLELPVEPRTPRHHSRSRSRSRARKQERRAERWALFRTWMRLR